MPKLNVSEARKTWGDFKKAQPKYAEVIGNKYQFGKLLDKYAATSESIVELGAQYLAAHKELESMMAPLLQTMNHMLQDVKKEPSLGKEEAKKLDGLLTPIFLTAQHNHEQIVKDAVELRKILPIL